MAKTEKEKMLAGELYDCGAADLVKRWHKAQRLTREYNQTDTADFLRRSKILEDLLGSKGLNVWLAPPFFCDYGENIHLGENCEINFNCVFLDCNEIRVGDQVLIGPMVQIYTVFHPVNPQNRFGIKGDQEFSFCRSQTAPVTIGDRAWIGGGAIILPGVTIGRGTTIGAGSVVTKSIPDNCLAVGNPCRVVRSLV